MVDLIDIFGMHKHMNYYFDFDKHIGNGIASHMLAIHLTKLSTIDSKMA